METPTPPGPDALERLEREALSALFRRFVAARMLLAPFPFLVLGAFLLSEPAAWRRVVLSVAVAGLWAYFALEYFTSRRKPEADMRPNLVAVVLIQLAVVLCTGALESPALPLSSVTLMVVGLLGSLRAAAWAALMLALSVGGLLWLQWAGPLPDLIPELFGGGVRAAPSSALLLGRAVFALLAGLSGLGLGAALRRTFGGLQARIFSAREELLHSYADQLHATNLLAGEVAHELKNPLASVKGLAGLLARDLEGKPAERLAVLRQEVDRMQEILEEFLNFSRPLVPLRLEEAALGPLCESVLALLEGQAQQRGARLLLTGEQGLAVRCDPRKVHQVLLNLTQNALEASPSGAEVEVHLAARGERVEVAVADRGPGLPEGDLERLFDPGVTTKAKGSGLGLAIARSLARQHGGDLTLARREGGGARALLSLPRDAGPASG